jgi:hypothetical protein
MRLALTTAGNTTAFKVWESWYEFGQSALILPAESLSGPGLKIAWWHNKFNPTLIQYFPNF